MEEYFEYEYYDDNDTQAFKLGDAKIQSIDKYFSIDESLHNRNNKKNFLAVDASNPEFEFTDFANLMSNWRFCREPFLILFPAPSQNDRGPRDVEHSLKFFSHYGRLCNYYSWCLIFFSKSVGQFVNKYGWINFH